jgi:hypothetical protein
MISDLIGIQPRTAERFAALAGENRSDYVADRAILPAPEDHRRAQAHTAGASRWRVGQFPSQTITFEGIRAVVAPTWGW